MRRLLKHQTGVNNVGYKSLVSFGYPALVSVEQSFLSNFTIPISFSIYFGLFSESRILLSSLDVSRSLFPYRWLRLSSVLISLVLCNGYGHHVPPPHQHIMSQHSPESHHPEQYDDEISQYEETQHAGDEEGTQREESLEPHPEHTSQYEESHHDNDEEMSQFEEDVDRSDEERSQDERTVYAGDEEMSQDEESRHSDDEDMSQDEDRSQDEDSDSSSQDGPTPRYYHALNGTMLNPLREELRKEGGKAIFACSGYIPVVPRPDVAQSPGSQHSSTTTSSVTSPPTTEPVTIRWDPPAADGLARHAKLVLPLEPETQDNLERLIDSTERASFGYKGKDTYDETYRKALKMDTTAFATTFDPYSLGIIDTIAQVLLPSMQESRLHRAVKAELYKLNVRTYYYALPLLLRNEKTDTTYGRSTRRRLASSRPTSTPLAATAKSGPLLCACRSRTRAASSKCATQGESSPTTGDVMTMTSPGPPSTAIVSTRYSR